MILQFFLAEITIHVIKSQGDVAIELCNNQVKEIPNILSMLGFTKILFLITRIDQGGGELYISVVY